jgi:hypothetical protein
LGTWWEHIGSKGENEKVFWHPPQLKRKIIGALECMIRLLIGCMYSLFWKLLVSCFWHQLLAFLRAWVWFNIYCYCILLLFIYCSFHYLDAVPPRLKFVFRIDPIWLTHHQKNRNLASSPKTKVWLKGNVSSLCPVM